MDAVRRHTRGHVSLRGAALIETVLSCGAGAAVTALVVATMYAFDVFDVRLYTATTEDLLYPVDAFLVNHRGMVLAMAGALGGVLGIIERGQLLRAKATPNEEPHPIEELIELDEAP